MLASLRYGPINLESRQQCPLTFNICEGGNYNLLFECDFIFFSKTNKNKQKNVKKKKKIEVFARSRYLAPQIIVSLPVLFDCSLLSADTRLAAQNSNLVCDHLSHQPVTVQQRLI